MQIAYGNKKEKNTNKPLNGHFKKAGVDPKRFLVEFEIVPGFNYEMGQVFNVSIFKQGDLVKVTGTSKGRGFSGVIKRHGFSRGPVTHGQREYLRDKHSLQHSFQSLKLIHSNVFQWTDHYISLD